MNTKDIAGIVHINDHINDHDNNLYVYTCGLWYIHGKDAIRKSRVETNENITCLWCMLGRIARRGIAHEY